MTIFYWKFYGRSAVKISPNLTHHTQAGVDERPNTERILTWNMIAPPVTHQSIPTFMDKTESGKGEFSFNIVWTELLKIGKGYPALSCLKIGAQVILRWGLYPGKYGTFNMYLCFLL